MNGPAAAPSAPSVPELGPSFGRLCAAPGAPPPGDPPRVMLDDIRLDLVAALFELAGAARGFAAAGDREGAVASLSRSVWLQPWEGAVGKAARRVAEWANARFGAAAAESRLPQRALQQILVSDEDMHGIAARLGAGGAGFVDALDALERIVPRASASGPRGDAAFVEWRGQLLATARQLETAWLALETAAGAEAAQWETEIERVRAWRRPRRPLWLLTALVFALATYLGLLLGGYLPVPGILRGFVYYWWYRL